MIERMAFLESVAQRKKTTPEKKNLLI